MSREHASKRTWLARALVVALLGAMAVYAATAREEFSSIRQVSAGGLAVAASLQLLALLVLNASMLLPLRDRMSSLGFWELYLVRTGGLFAGAVVPVAGGLAVRLAYLRNRGLTYQEFAWATLFSNVLALAAAGVVTIGATAALWARVGRPPGSVLAVAGVVVGASVAAVITFGSLPKLTQRPWFPKWRAVSDIRDAWATPRMAAAVFGYSLARHVLNFVAFGWLYRAASGAPDDIARGGLVYALTSPVRMINITPGNIGITEWFVALVGRLLEYDVVLGLAVALAFRGVGLVAQGVGALFGIAWVTVQGRS